MYSFITYTPNEYDLNSCPQFLIIPPAGNNGNSTFPSAASTGQLQNRQLDAPTALTPATQESRSCAKSSIYYRKQPPQASSLENMRRRKYHKQTKRKEVVELAANLVPGNVGDQSVETLLKYINDSADCNSREKYDNHQATVESFGALKKPAKSAQTKKNGKLDDSCAKANKMSEEEWNKEKVHQKENGLAKKLNNEMCCSTKVSDENIDCKKSLAPTQDSCVARLKASMDCELNCDIDQEDGMMEAEVGFQQVVRKKPSLRRPKPKRQATYKNQLMNQYNHEQTRYNSQKVDYEAVNNDAQSSQRDPLTVVQYLQQLNCLKMRHPEDYPVEKNENARNAFLILQNRLRADFAALESEIQRFQII